MSTSVLIAIALLAVLSAFTAGLLGAGGDILYLPLLLYGLPEITGSSLDIHTITGLSLVQSVASTAAGGLRHHREGRVETGVLWPAWLAIAGGAVVGGAASKVAPGHALLVTFAVVTSAAVVLLGRPPHAARLPVLRRRDGLASTLLAASSAVSGAVGIGGGFLIITVLLHRVRLSMDAARGTGLALTFFAAIAAFGGKAATGQVVWGPVPFIVVAGVVGSILGTRVSGLVSSRVLGTLLAALVAVLAVRVWLTVFGVMS